METKKALITGFTGQDGQYLSKFLLEKGYLVDAIVRRTVGRANIYRLDGLDGNVEIHEGDIRSYHTMANVLKDTYYDEIYHLAAQSDVSYSFKHPQETYDTNITGTLNMFNAVKDREDWETKIYFAGTSELYGKPERKPQNEKYPFNPVSPYGVSKLAGFYTAATYRRAYDMFICSGILFNHESPLRGDNFVTQKIVKGIRSYVRYSYRPALELGNLEALKDWGHAKDYVRGMWMMLQHDKADDYVLATGIQHSVKDFIKAVLEEYGISYIIKQPIVNNSYYDIANNQVIKINADYFRPNEADNYMGDYDKAWKTLGWKPQIGFRELVNDMVKT